MGVLIPICQLKRLVKKDQESALIRTCTVHVLYELYVLKLPLPSAMMSTCRSHKQILLTFLLVSDQQNPSMMYRKSHVLPEGENMHEAHEKKKKPKNLDGS